MLEHVRVLAPSAEWLPLLDKGIVRINEAANRVVWADSGQMAAALYPIPGRDLVRQLTDGVANNVASQLQPALNALQLTSTVGALASVANIGVSCVGFALVLHRLAKMDGKLDEVLAKVDRLRASVDAIQTHLEALSVARMESAAESLARSLVATTEPVRSQLATEARSLFQESRKLYLALWHKAGPWNHNDFPVSSALELMNRYIAAALGEIQAEFILGDDGAFRHAVRSCSKELITGMSLDAASALRMRSDEACAAGIPALAQFDARLPTTIEALKVARESISWSGSRLAAFEQDMDMAHAVGIEPFELARIVQSATDADLYVVGAPAEIHRMRVRIAAEQERTHAGTPTDEQAEDTESESAPRRRAL